MQHTFKPCPSCLCTCLNTLGVSGEAGLDWGHCPAHRPQDPSPTLLCFQTSPGVYDEAGLEALDFVLHTASLLGLRVILCLVDNWLYLNGVDQVGNTVVF